MTDKRLGGAEAETERSDISGAMRDCYIGYRRAQAELDAWLELRRDEDEAIENQLRAREGSALDELIRLPAATLADLSVKLEVLRELAAGELPQAPRDIFNRLAEDSANLASRGAQEGRLLALRLALTLLLNAAAVDRESLLRTRQAVLDLIDRPEGPFTGEEQLAQIAKDEVAALFTWIE